ncbi:hypothetical protein MED193_08483 [Roseobacter sp. MED193]|nr:hypothetical protein MED193_08483 [Roseobacter sp. MED193]
MCVLQAANSIAGAAHHMAVFQRVGGQQIFQIGGLGGIKVQPLAVQQQPQGRLSGAARMDGAQKGVFYAQKIRAVFGCNAAPTMGGGGIAPDPNQVTLFWQAKTELIPRKVENAAQPWLGNKPAIVYKKPGALALGF